MRRFFDQLPRPQQSLRFRVFDLLSTAIGADKQVGDITPQEVAVEYGSYLLDKRRRFLKEKAVTDLRSRYYVGMLADSGEFAEVTKRASLVTDTLLLSHSRGGSARQVYLDDVNLKVFASLEYIGEDPGPPSPEYKYEMLCPDFAGIGQWILQAEGLLRAGLAWYLPRYSISSRVPVRGSSFGDIKDFNALDYLVQDRRLVALSGAAPEKGELVRPILRIDLPFVDRVDLPTFTKITVDEFASYQGFRDFLRSRFLDLDSAMDSVQSRRALDKMSLEIADHVRGVESEVRRIGRKRPVAVTGAALGTVSAVLAAVYGPAFHDAIMAVGASGGVWGLLTAMSENNPKHALSGNKWYYAWILQRNADRN